MKQLIIILGLLFLFAVGCTSAEEDNSRFINESVEERLLGFRRNFLTDCREKVLESARFRADSLLLARARRLRLLAGRPPKPSRPGSPVEKQLSRELPLRPLFPFEIRFDTLLRDSLFQDSLRLDSLDRFGPGLDSLELPDNQ